MTSDGLACRLERVGITMRCQAFRLMPDRLIYQFSGLGSRNRDAQEKTEKMPDFSDQVDLVMLGIEAFHQPFQPDKAHERRWAVKPVER